MKRLAAVRSALLSVLFLAVYGGCNWITAQRTDVGVWYFGWERHIPYVPLMIVPYLSIDAFFLAAPFLCRDRDELNLFTRRVVAAIVMAGICFVVMPLRFAFDRPSAGGTLEAIFAQFTALDRPFNLFPSLHIALAALLIDVYWHRTRGLIRAACAVWFFLTGVSTVLTYQHHLIDVAGGLGLAVVVFYVWRERPAHAAGSRNYRVAAYYLVGAGLGTVLAAILWPWGALLLWPACSLALASAAYMPLGPWVFAKSNGRIPFVTWLLLWPCLAGHHLSLAWYRRQCRTYDPITPNVWIGRRLDAKEADAAVAAGVTAVLDLTAELNEAPAFTRVAYANLQTLDLSAPAAGTIDAAVRFISKQSRRGIVYVHCKIGYSRTAAVVGAWLLSSGVARSADDAIAMVRGARPQIVVRPEAVAALRQHEARLFGKEVPHTRRPSFSRVAISTLFGGLARLICGSPHWVGCRPDARPRIYFANHSSHLDFPVMWGSLPRDVRLEARPVAGRDYWTRNALRRLIAKHAVRAVLVDRSQADETDREARTATARRSVTRAARALGTGASLIIFPEGTRGDGTRIAPFKSGLYHLLRMRPDAELVPVYLENLHRILPKGAILPLPLSGSITFGPPIRLRRGEDKHAFLMRARAALITLKRPCRSQSIAILRAS